jgi:excisionase family DNA binding protein
MTESGLHAISLAPQLSTEAERLLTVHEVAELLRVPVSWVYERTRRRGSERIPHLKMGKYVRFRPAEIEAYLEGLPRA